MTTIEATSPQPGLAAYPVPAHRTGAHRPRTRRPWEADYLRLLIVADLLAGMAAAAGAYLVRFGPITAPYTERYLVLSLILPFCWAGVLAMARAYEPRLLFVGMSEYQATLRAGLWLTIGAVLLSYSLHADVARGYLILVVALTTTLSMTGRFIMRRRLHAERAQGRAVRRVLAVGHAAAVADLTRQLRRRSHHGMHVVAACVPAAYGDRRPELDVPVFGTLDRTSEAALRADADTVVVLPAPELDGPALRRLAWDLERDGVELIMAASLLDVTGDRIAVRPVDGLTLMHIEHPTLSGGRKVLKSVFEAAAAGVLLTVLAPLLLLLTLLVRLDSPGPALYRQLRVGRHGREFPMIKFRTMVVDADRHTTAPTADSVLFKLRADPRVTRVGRYLRRYSLDELPQLINVLRGQMALVGPRPPLASEVAAYPADMRRRLLVKPGMTGLWQVSGRSDLPWDEAVRLDLHYVENWSLTLDLVILLRTVVAVVRGSGAY